MANVGFDRQVLYKKIAAFRAIEQADQWRIMFGNAISMDLGYQPWKLNFASERVDISYQGTRVSWCLALTICCSWSHFVVNVTLNRRTSAPATNASLIPPRLRLFPRRKLRRLGPHPPYPIRNLLLRRTPMMILIQEAFFHGMANSLLLCNRGAQSLV